MALFSTHEVSDATIHPAATILLCRTPSLAQPPQVYLAKRAQRSRFMGSFYVFPGGRVEAEDIKLAKSYASDTTRANALVPGEPSPVTAHAFAIAAIRETAEETGIFILTDQSGNPVDATLTPTLRSSFHQGCSFPELLKAYSLSPDFDALRPFGWWITPPFERRRYDTRFFRTTIPPGQEGEADGVEITEAHWFETDDVLRRYEASEVSLAPPTLATLEMVHQGTDPLSFNRPLCPELIREEHHTHLVLPGDASFSPA